MAKQLLEALSGVGDIYSGKLLLRADVPYDLSLWSDSPADVTLEGILAIAGMPEATVLAGSEDLILTLQDGRRFAFALTGTSGRIVGRPGIQPA
jgi:hypothetical protein